MAGMFEGQDPQNCGMAPKGPKPSELFRNNRPTYASEIVGTSLRNCSFCKAVEQRGDTFKVCGGCRVAMYCSPNCQKSDWKEVHKVECKKLQGLP